MPMSINTNIGSLNAQRQLNRSQAGQMTSMERLSSGLRINSAKDDAAGLAISDRMTAQVKGLNQAVRNANDGISITQVAEGALQESTNILQRMRELSVQSANDSNSATDRASLQKEVSQLQQELNRIADTTTFNGKKVLNGSFTAQKFQVGAFANESIDVSIRGGRADVMGNNTVTTNGTATTAIAAGSGLPASTVVDAEDLTITGTLGTGTVDVAAGGTAGEIAAQVNGITSQTGVEADAITQATIGGLSNGTVSFNLFGTDSATGSAVSATISNSSDLSNLVDAINGVAASTGITAEFTGGGRDTIKLVSTAGDDIGIEDVSGSNFTVTGLNADGTTTSVATLDGSTGPSNDSTRVGGDVTFKAAESFTVTSDTAGGLFSATTANVSALSSVAAIDIGTQTGSNSALDVIDGALSYVANIRSDLGAIQNRFGSTIANLENVSQNVSAARSRIQDADFAQESSNLAKSQILQQAGISMLAQANASSQSVLSLLQ